MVIKKAYTLIEVLAAVSIFAGMMVIAIGTFSAAVASETAYTTKRLLNQSARRSVESMIDQISYSQNHYSADGSLDLGQGAYTIIQKDGQPNSSASLAMTDSTSNIDQTQETNGNGLVVFYRDPTTGIRNARAFYLCPHPLDPNQSNPTSFSFGYKNIQLGLDLNFSNQWLTLNNKIDCSTTNGYQQLTDNNVVVTNAQTGGNGDIKISGYYPEQGLTVQPHLTISVSVRSIHANANRPEDQSVSTYRASINHREYGRTSAP